MPNRPEVDGILVRAALSFVPTASSVEPVPGHTDLARAEAPGGVWAVRRWPEGTPRERVEFVQEVSTGVRAAGIGFVPAVGATPGDGATAVVVEGRLYSAESWLPGKSLVRGTELVAPRGRVVDRSAPVPAAVLGEAIRAVASFHQATEAMATRPGVARAPLDAVLRAVRSTWEEERVRLRPLAPRTPHIQRWIRSGEVVLASAVEALAAVDFLRVRPAVIGHLNLWPGHVLASRVGGEDRITGLVDLADAAASSPLVDLAQLVGHFNGWTTVAAEEAIGAYTEVRPLAPEERRLLPAVAGLDLVAATGRLLVLGYATQAMAGGAAGDAVRASASQLLSSLEALAPAVRRGDRPEPSRARKWDYGPRRRPVPRASPGKGATKTPDRSVRRRPERPDS